MYIFQGSVDDFLKMLLHSLTPQPPEKTRSTFSSVYKRLQASKPQAMKQQKWCLYLFTLIFFLTKNQGKFILFVGWNCSPTSRTIYLCVVVFLFQVCQKKTPLSSRHKKHINFVTKKLCFFSTFELPDHEEDLHRIRSFHEHLASTV